MSTNPPNVRYPFTFPEDIPESIVQACRYLFNGLHDNTQAIKGLKTQQTTAVAATPAPITPLIASASPGSSQPSTIGNVNLLASSLTAYTTQQADFGGLIVVNSAVAFAYTLNSALVLPFYACVLNIGAGIVTFTPSVGNVNGGATVLLLTNQFAIVFYDGANWEALITINTVGLPVFANNGAALAGGLVAGDLYRTNANPDFLAVVH